MTQFQPIDLYYWPTPNGWKISIMLEECDLPYTVHGVDIGAGEQFEPAFLAISPNNRMPAIVDPEGPDGQPISVFESGAIPQYLAGKTGRFGGDSPRERVAVSEWLFWQMGGLGPMAGQANHFRIYAAEKIPYAIDRYTNEVNRLFGVMNHRLVDHEYLAGPYSIADMACIGWTRPGSATGRRHRFPPSRALARRGAGAAAGPARAGARYSGPQAARPLDRRGSPQRFCSASARDRREAEARRLQRAYRSGICRSRFGSGPETWPRG
jgi:GSH-dependent disulfide-bond oxidoreductase